jgi:hypothetical protein
MTGARITGTLLNGLQHTDGTFGIEIDVRRRRPGHGDGRRTAPLSPSTVDRLRAEVQRAEAADSDDARLAAYDVIRQHLDWLGHGLDDPDGTYPSGGATG